MGRRDRRLRPWLLISGDFNHTGGMDRPNYELAWHLADRLDRPVHLVSHAAASPLAHHPKVTWHRVPRPLGRHGPAAPLLAWRARRLLWQLSPAGVHVVANGGCYTSPDVNWVHAVHAAWDRRDSHAGVAYRLRAAVAKRRARRCERRALRAANMVITNSDRARWQVIRKVGIHPGRVHRVYYGIDPAAFRPRSPQERSAARHQLGWATDRLVVVFIGALGHDRNKGFDVLFDAWRYLCQDPSWDVDLVAAGAGAEVTHWQRRCRAEGLQRRVRMIGFTRDIPQLLAAADALVSPTHYDAYGQGVHEALASGLPAFVTRTAGVAERFPRTLDELLLRFPPSPADVADRLCRWRRDPRGFQTRARAFGQTIRERSWRDMAAELVQLIQAPFSVRQGKAA